MAYDQTLKFFYFNNFLTCLSPVIFGKLLNWGFIIFFFIIILEYSKKYLLPTLQ